MEKKIINQMEPWIGDEETEAMGEYLRSGGWLTEFRVTREFERLISEYVGSRYVSVVNNGTVSLSIALMALGVTRDDEVLVPDYTMIASANAVLLAGGKPILVDIESETLCMDLAKVKEAITWRTKAMIFVSLNGRCPDMSEVKTFAIQHGLFLVEDAAQSLGSRHNGKHLGRFGEVGSFSFSVPKVITTGQGGCLVTDNESIYQKIKKIKDFGRERGGVDLHEELGFNFKFTDLQAVIGIEQMKKLSWRVERKKRMFSLYQKLLEDIEEVKFVHTNLEDTSPWFIDILVPNPLGLQAFLKEEGIGTRPFYPPVHTQAPYRLNAMFPVSEYVSTHGLWLPSSSFLSDEDIAYICSKIRKFFSKRNGLTPLNCTHQSGEIRVL
jgi:perosamine synthetase